MKLIDTPPASPSSPCVVKSAESGHRTLSHPPEYGCPNADSSIEVEGQVVDQGGTISDEDSVDVFHLARETPDDSLVEMKKRKANEQTGQADRLKTMGGLRQNCQPEETGGQGKREHEESRMGY